MFGPRNDRRVAIADVVIVELTVCIVGHQTSLKLSSQSIRECCLLARTGYFHKTWLTPVLRICDPYCPKTSLEYSPCVQSWDDALCLGDSHLIAQIEAIATL